MPLLSGKENIGRNIRELKKANVKKRLSKKRPKKQILAIALSKAYGPKTKKTAKRIKRRLGSMWSSQNKKVM